MSGDDSKPKVGENRGNAGKGRPRGSKNKTTVKAKDAIMMAAEGIGGVDRLTKWVKEDPANERVFWSQIYTKLLPLQVKGEDDKAIPVSVVERVIVKAAN